MLKPNNEHSNVDQAIQAIDNVIADGLPHWQEILA